MGKLFGTDGVRGIANLELTPELAFKLGQAAAFTLGKENKGKEPVILIGKDGRISGDMLEDALSAGVLSVGGSVIKAGVIPTPAVAYLIKKLNLDAGAVISASHNTYEYNGIKLFKGDGFKLEDELEDEIENIVIRGMEVDQGVTGEKLGKIITPTECLEDLYEEFLLSTVNYSLKGKKIVIDCANGASYRIGPKVFKKLGAEVVVIGDRPDGININENCGSTHPEKLQELVIAEKADFGMAYDGDADRLIGVDNQGEIVDGDKLLCICAKMLREENQLTKSKLTVTVMSNIGLHRYIADHDMDVVVTGVGDRYVLESMQKTGSTLGGEQSGHMIFLNHTTTGDGILSSLQAIKAILEDGRTFAEISKDIQIYPQVLKNAKIKNENKKKFEKDQEFQDKIKEIEQTLKGRGRVLIRPSGTEPLVRVMIEGEDIKIIKSMAETLKDLLEKKYS